MHDAGASCRFADGQSPQFHHVQTISPCRAVIVLSFYLTSELTRRTGPSSVLSVEGLLPLKRRSKGFSTH